MKEDPDYPKYCPDFTEQEVETVYNYMNPKKSPGEDGLTADICYQSYKTDREIQLGIFNKCLQCGYFPKIWKKARIKVIPKPGKECYTIPKSYRPIGLLPVLGKVLEKLISTRMSWEIGNSYSNQLSSRQYGFIPQRSTEDALYDALQIIKKGVARKQIVAVISLDIEGAFDNCWWPGLKMELYKKKIDEPTMKLIASYLEDRSISLSYLDETVEKLTNKGCVQGSICGPLFWNIQLDPLLHESDKLEAHIQAFADDILVIGCGRTALEVEHQINNALKTVAEWGKSHKMKFAAHKTQVMLVTKRLKYDVPRLELNGQHLDYTDSIKFLGVTIDKALTFRPHLENVSRKAINIYKMLSRAVKTKWGLNPDITRLIYLAAVEPIVLYAASVWGNICSKKYARARLNRLTRIFAIKICRAHRTTSMMASALIARIFPLDLRLKENARLYEVKRGKPLEELPGRKLEMRVSPFQLRHPALRKRLQFKRVSNEEEVVAIKGLKIFTDGSKIDGKVGAAITCWNEGEEVHKIKTLLASYCTVFQAELIAILKAMAFINEKGPGTILSDSRAALETISDPNTDNPIAAEIQELLQESCYSIDFYWIKAHAGICGNERADELAKEAAQKSKTAPAYDAFPLSFARRSIRQETKEYWNSRYAEDVTAETTKLFFPDSEQAYRILNKLEVKTIRTQLFTGHCGIKYYLHRFKLIDDPFCTCDDQSPETIVHIITECPKYDFGRMECEWKTDLQLTVPNLKYFIQDDHRRKHFLAFAEKALGSAVKANGSTIAL